MKLLWIFFAALAVFYLQRALYRKYWKRGLTARVAFADSSLCEGEETILTEEIVNDKRMPLPALEIRFALDRQLSYLSEAKENASISDKTYRRDVFSLFSRQKTRRSFPVFCGRRGCYEIDEIEMIGHDFFFQKEYLKRITQRSRIYVYPRLVDVRRIRVITRALSGMRLTQSRVYQDPFAFAGIRAYDRTDPMNRINWKASAKTGELMVNQYDATTNVKVKCFLDVADSHILKYPHLVEESISIASSLATQLVAQRMDVDIISNARYQKGRRMEKLFVSMKAGISHLEELYQKLACVRTDQIYCPMEKLLEEEANQADRDCLYVLISKNQDAETLCGAKELLRGGGRLLWVLVTEPAGPALREDMLRWEVTTK